MADHEATVAEEEYLQIDLLAPGGGAADHRREHRPRHAGLGPDRPRDDRAPRGATATSRAATDKSLDFTDTGHEHAAADRAPPPADRALPHRRARHPVGRGARGGGAARARDVARARGAHARRDRRRHDLPARPPDRRGRARSRACRWRTSRRAPRCACCASRTRPRTCSIYLKDAGLYPGLEGTLGSADEDEVTIDAGGEQPLGHAQRRGDRLGRSPTPHRRPARCCRTSWCWTKDRYGR